MELVERVRWDNVLSFVLVGFGGRGWLGLGVVDRCRWFLFWVAPVAPIDVAVVIEDVSYVSISICPDPVESTGP